MANSYTDRYKLRLPAAGDLNWDDENNQDHLISEILGAARDQNNRVIYGLAASDGGGLTVSYAAGRAEIDGSIFEIAASSKTAIDDTSARSVNWLYIDDSGVVQISQTAPTGNYAPIAVVDVFSGAIDRIGDFRQQPSGLLADETLAEINKIIATTANIVDVCIINITEWFDTNPNDLPALIFVYADNVGVKFHNATDVQLPIISALEITLANIISMPDLITGRLFPVGSNTGVNVYDIGNNSDLFTTYSTTTTPALPNNLVNDVYMAVLSGAPIDQTTGLPVPTLAVATDGSVRVIKDDGTAVSYRDVSGDDTNDVLMTSYGSLIYTNETQTNLDVFRNFKLDTVTQETPDKSYDTTSIPALLANPDTISRGLVESFEGIINIGSASGITLLKEDPATPANGMVNYVTKSYHSGWMPGDIRRAFLANSKTADRSVKSATLVENGTVTEADVATGAELKDYSGWSAVNYLEEAYSADLDFGTSDFYIIGWLKEDPNTLLEIIFDRDSVATAQRIDAYINTDGTISFTCDDDTTVRTASSTIAVDDGSPHLYCMSYSGGTLTIRRDSGEEIATATGAALLTLSNAAAVLTLGATVNHSAPLINGFLALWRIGAGVPSDEQINHIFETEKHLFQENADCTLSGTSDAVAALAHDDVNDLLYVGTGDGVSVFSGLQRVDYIDTTGIPTSDAVNSLSASGGAYIIGNAAEAVGYIPAANLREEIVRQEQSGEILEIHWDVGDTSETVFVMPAGYKPKFVFEAGLIVKEGVGEDYTVAFDGFLYTVVFASAPAAVKLGFMIVRV